MQEKRGPDFYYPEPVPEAKEPGVPPPPGRRETDEPPAGTDEESPGERSESERTLSSGSPADRSPGPQTSAAPERGRGAAKLGYVIAALLAANLLALLAVCLLQYRANRDAMDAVRETLDSLQTAERLEAERKTLQEEIDGLEEEQENLYRALSETWTRRDQLDLDYQTMTYLWTAADEFESGDYEMCANLLRYLFHPAQGTALTFGGWDSVQERVIGMARRLEELGYLKEGDVMIPYAPTTPDIGEINLGTAVITVPE